MCKNSFRLVTSAVLVGIALSTNAQSYQGHYNSVYNPIHNEPYSYPSVPQGNRVQETSWKHYGELYGFRYAIRPESSTPISYANKTLPFDLYYKEVGRNLVIKVVEKTGLVYSVQDNPFYGDRDIPSLARYQYCYHHNGDYYVFFNL